MMTNLLFSQFTAIGKRFAMVLTMLLIVGIGQAWGYTITFSTGNNTGTKATTSTTCASLVSEGSDYLTGNLQTATNVYPTTSNNLRIGNSSATGTLKMNLSNNGKVNATTIIVKAKQYTSDKGKTLKVNGSQVQTPANNWGDLTFTINADITYIELVASGYLYVQSITINTNAGESGDNATCGWIETDISNISSTDDVVITMTNGTTTWALTNGNGTSNAPEATPLTMNTDGSISENPNQISDAILWNISTSNNTLTISPKEDPSIWLYVNNSTGNNVRVGNAVNANSNGTFIIEGNYLKNVTKSYYIGVYSNSNWRCYANTTGNIAGQTLKFYKYVACGSTEPTVYAITYNTNGGTINAGNVTDYAEGVGATLPTNVTKTGYTFAGWYNNSDFTGDPIETIGTTETGNKEFWAKWTINKYTVTLNPNYPNGKTGTFTYEEGELVDGNLVLTYDYNTASKEIESLYTSLSLDGYEFGGWYNAKGVNPGEVSGSKCTETNTITSNKTYYAKWSKLYTVTFSENGTTTTPITQTSTSYTLPTELTAGSCQDDTKELVGWSTVAIPNPGGKPTKNFYELGATVPLTADQTTFYAVFATEGEGGVDNTDYSNVHTSNVTLDNTDGTSATNSKVKISEVDYTAVKAGTGSATGAVKITVPAGTTKLSFHMAGWNKEGGKTISLSGATADPSSFNTVADAGVSGNSTTYTLSGTIADYFYSTTLSNIDEETTLTFSNGGADQRFVIWGVNASTGGGVSYTNYTTTCVPIPDPVWGGAEIDNATIAVNCGDTSSMNSAATISFPAKTNNTLTYDITVTASDGFLVSTNQTNNAGYGESVTVSPVKTGDNAGTITQNVYVRAVAPAMSSAQFTGTITISGKQIETQTIEVTADVTCTQYTLTLVDRGVSTEQPTKYYAGETINEAPADPTGVCTDPIHYVFDGWAEAAVAEGSTTYTKVTFPYTVKGNTEFHAVYRYVEDGSGDSGDYVKVTDNLDDYSGDYLFVYETDNVAFDGGRNNVDDELDATSNTIEVTINDNTIASNATTDAAKFTIAKVDGGYSIQSASGYYIGWSTADENGLNANSKYSANYYLNTISNSIISGVKGTLKYNKTSGQERFRYYKSGQEDIALYRKAASYLYTTSPVCGPHLVITEGKEIYVTGGNAKAARDLVMAQQKVSYKATRLYTEDGSAGGTAPDVKVATNGITKGGVVTKEVKVTFENTVKEQQADDTYTITGDIVVTYEADANNMQEDIQVQLAVDYPANADARDNFIVHTRSLPSEFVIVAKQGDKWYALNADMSSSKAQPANGQVTLNNLNNPTEATYAPCNAIYSFEAMPQGAEDRISVRFIGQDNKYLWAASGTNTGIQNNSTNPAADALAYNWKLYTQDNITYQFGNANSNRQLTLNGEKFGMYASGVQDIRILPYVEKCLYNYAPSNLKVSVLKGTYVTLTWDAVIGATKYQYSTDATNWTDCGTEPTATINGLTGDKEYTYYIRAYHEDAGVSQECIDYAEITFTTANCDDVPTDIICSSDLNSILVSWTANAATSTVKLYSDEEGTTVVKNLTNATSPCIFDNLSRNTTYYVQVFANGTCASQIVQVSTEDVKVDVVEWLQNGIIVDINTDETIGVTLENEVSYGSGTGAEATELFFSKYYEATTNVKLVAIYNGTKNIIDLTPYTIQYGKTSWESNYITLKDFGETKGQIQPGEELILYTMGTVDSDVQIMDCVNAAYPDGKWVRVTQTNNDGKGYLSFGGDKTIVLKKSGTIIDIIGAIDSNGLPTNTAVTEPSWGDAKGWTCTTGLSIADNTEIGISTNRCLLIRNNDVTSGANAVESNVDNFVTLCNEWKGAHVPDSDEDNGVAASCENFAYVGTFDYSDYYTQYEKIGSDLTFDENQRNPDGTVTIPIAELYKQSCRNIRITLSNSSNEVLSNREYKVPIMVAFDQTTSDTVFTNMQNYLATIEKDSEGNVVTHPLTFDEVREICKTCDIIIRDGATLSHIEGGIDQFQDITIYPTAKLSNINTALTVNKLMIQSEIIDNIDTVGYAIIEQNGGSLTANAIGHTKRIDAQWWYPFSLPYDCDIADITQANGESMGEYGVHWGIQYYDGERRQKEGTSASLGQSSQYWTPMAADDRLNAHQGYVIALFDASVQSPTEKRTIYFPPVDESKYTESGNDAKKTDVYNWNVNLNAAKRHHGWNFTGSPYISMFNPTAAGITDDALDNILMTGYYEGKYSPFEDTYEEDGLVYITAPIPPSSLYYRQRLATTTSLKPFAAYFVQTVDPTTDDNETKNLTYVKGGRELPASAPARAAATKQRVLVELNITAPDGQTDNTGIWVDEQYTTDYEIAADLTKMYATGTRPQLYTLAANNEKLAYNALPDNAATNIPLGLYAPKAGDYTLTLNERVSRVAGAETVELLYNNQLVANLLYQDYTITANKGTVSGYSLSIRRRADVSTAVDNTTGSTITLIANDEYISLVGVPTDATISIYDMLGRLISSQQANGQSVVNMPIVPQGVYNIVVANGTGYTTIKSVIK